MILARYFHPRNWLQNLLKLQPTFSSASNPKICFRSSTFTCNSKYFQEKVCIWLNPRLFLCSDEISKMPPEKLPVCFISLPSFEEERPVVVLTNDTLRLYTGVDECAAKTHNCHEDAYCTNVGSSFTCTCVSGYSGNGTVCTGKYYVGYIR